MSERIKQLFIKYKDPVFRYFHRFLHDRDLSLDLTQEVFYKLMVSEEELNLDRNVENYIFRVAKNMLIDQFKKFKTEEKYRNYLKHVWQNSSNDYSLNCEKELEFNQIISHLSPQQKLLITLHKKADLSYFEMSKLLDLSINTVRNHIHRGFKKIRSKYASIRDVYADLNKGNL